MGEALLGGSAGACIRLENALLLDDSHTKKVSTETSLAHEENALLNLNRQHYAIHIEWRRSQKRTPLKGREKSEFDGS